MIFQNARIITPYRIIEGDLHIRDGKIEKTAPLRSVVDKNSSLFDCHYQYIAPGFIDLHLHGAGGSDFMDGTAEAFITTAQMHLSHGTTSLMPTTLTGTMDDIVRCLEAYQEASLAPKMPNFLGMHLEGPYFSMAQRGAQDPRFIKNPDPKEYLPLLDRFPFIKRWSLAPELPGSLEMGKELVQRGIIAAIAHTDTDYEIILQAMEQGFSLLTHFYSGMSGIFRKNAYRYAGVIEAGYLLDDLPVEIIADGKHLPVSLLKLIHKVKGTANMCLISDSLRAAGLGEGEFLLGGLDSGQTTIVEDGVAKLPDRSAFAGSVTAGDQLIRTIHKSVGIPLEDAVRMMTVNPARIIGISNRKGKIAPGFDADLVILDNDIVATHVFVAGNLIS